MFSICEAMKWAHLPLAGGIYDQHPDLIDGFMVIFAARAQHENEEAKKQERKNRSAGKSRAGRGR